MCSSNAKWDKYREVWGGWERGIVLMAGGVFEFLWLKECGQKPQGDVYSFMREAYSPSVDREYFYKIRESYTDEAEYVSFIEAINWAIDAWENGGRDFVAQYVSFKNGVTSKVTVHEEGDVLYSVDFDITYCKNAEYEFDLYVPLDGNLIDNLKELDEVLIQNGQDISYEEEFVDGAEVICITITITSNNKHLVEQLEKLDYKFKVEPQLDEEDYLLVA